MSLNRSDVQDLYTKSIDRYASFIAAFQSPLAMQALLRTSSLLRDGLHVLDAGCGFGMVTFALLKALREKNLDYKAIDAFDLTPAMLTSFRSEIEARGISRIQLQQAGGMPSDIRRRNCCGRSAKQGSPISHFGGSHCAISG